jgi:hypothetical protein
MELIHFPLAFRGFVEVVPSNRRALLIPQRFQTAERVHSLADMVMQKLA